LSAGVSFISDYSSSSRAICSPDEAKRNPGTAFPDFAPALRALHPGYGAKLLGLGFGEIAKLRSIFTWPNFAPLAPQLA
jgi:hypothetical protein